jgi:hypothetical protein
MTSPDKNWSGEVNFFSALDAAAAPHLEAQGDKSRILVGNTFLNVGELSDCQAALKLHDIADIDGHDPARRRVSTGQYRTTVSIKVTVFRRRDSALGGEQFSTSRGRFFKSDMEIIMFYRIALFAAVVASAGVGGPLRAEPFKPIQAQKVEIGPLTGVAYYTVEPDGHRLVLTLQTRESDTPFRVVATLTPGQTVTLSVPLGAGEPAIDVRFTRDDEQISMNSNGKVARLQFH